MTYKREKQIDFVRFINDFSDSEVSQVSREFNFILARGNCKILIDISELVNIGQQAIAMLLHISKKATRRNGCLILIGPSKHIVAMFKSLQIDNVLNCFTCKNSAVQALCQS